MYIINSINSEKRGGGGRLAIYIKIHPWAFTRAGAFARAVTVHIEMLCWYMYINWTRTVSSGKPGDVFVYIRKRDMVSTSANAACILSKRHNPQGS